MRKMNPMLLVSIFVTCVMLCPMFIPLYGSSGVGVICRMLWLMPILATWIIYFIYLDDTR